MQAVSIERSFLSCIMVKGWYVEELKKLGVTKHEGRKLQSLKHISLQIFLSKETQLISLEKAAHLKLMYGFFKCAEFVFLKTS